MKLIKNIKLFIISLVVIVFELTAGKYIAVGGISPMITFSLCLAMALLEDNPVYVAAVPAILGAVLDIMCGHGFGTYTITFELSSVLTFFVRDKVFSSKILMLIPDVFIMTLMCESLYYLLHIRAVNSTDYIVALISLIIPTALYNIVLCLIFYSVLRVIFYKRR
ncbi:MAG: hypothetical protein PUB42_05750 [Firmicutes bacterium]|nr:hypothetical protein [Bacillota bacterium]